MIKIDDDSFKKEAGESFLIFENLVMGVGETRLNVCYITEVKRHLDYIKKI